MMKKQLILLKNIPNSRLECTNHTLFQTKRVEIDTLFQTKTVKKKIPFGAAHTYIAYLRDYSLTFFCVLCCNLAESKSVLKMCFSKHCHDVTGFLLWIGTYCISCVVQQRSSIKGLFSLVGYDDSCLAAISHVKSFIHVIEPRPNIRSHSLLLLWFQIQGELD